jgi:hypothetical protein
MTREEASSTVIQEFSTDEFAARLGLPPGSTVSSIGMIWFDLTSSAGNNLIRVRYRPGPRTPLRMLVPAPLEDRLRRLAAKWNSQSRHPQRRNQPEVRELLEKHASELLSELAGQPAAGQEEKESEQSERQ